MIDVKQQISAVRRTLGSRRLEAGEARVSTLSQVFDTGIDDLWDVVTNPERIPRWLLDELLGVAGVIGVPLVKAECRVVTGVAEEHRAQFPVLTHDAQHQ